MAHIIFPSTFNVDGTLLVTKTKNWSEIETPANTQFYNIYQLEHKMKLVRSTKHKSHGHFIPVIRTNDQITAPTLKRVLTDTYNQWPPHFVQ